MDTVQAGPIASSDTLAHRSDRTPSSGNEPPAGQHRIRDRAWVGLTPAFWRGLAGVCIFLAIWELATSADDWFGVRVPFVAALPSASAFFTAWFQLFGQPTFWDSCYLSFTRVAAGFVVALVAGIAFGVLLAANRTARSMLFPPFEILRPIPPLAWVPLAILFWPTQELSIIYVTFLGAFFPIVVNIVGGAEQIDTRLLLAARSMGAGQLTTFRRVILPATLPSIAVGGVVGIGIAWQAVVAAELIGGGGESGIGGGLGFLIWNSYNGGAIAIVMAGMATLGLIGSATSTVVRVVAGWLMPWQAGS